MTKQEIRNIIEQGWDSRRAAQKEKNKKNSEATAAWTLKEGGEAAARNIRRWRHYLGLGRGSKIKKEQD
jgi:hypothetical protein